MVDVQVPGVLKIGPNEGPVPPAGLDPALPVGLVRHWDERLGDEDLLAGVLAVAVVVLQCFHWERLYRGMSAGMGATVITKVVVVVGAALVGTGVDVAVAGTGVETTVGASLGASLGASVGVGGGVADDWPGAGPMSSPQSAPALARSVKSPSPAAIIASAISPGPPSWSKRHCIPSRSSGGIPVFDAAASHSSSFRHAIVTESAVMLPAIALPGRPLCPRS